MADDTATMVQPAPGELQETAPEPVKRRGRPPGSKNSTTTGTTAKRGRPRKSLEEKIGGMLTMVNLVFAFAPAELQGDALDMMEISALAKALDAAAKENPTLYKYLDAALGGSGSAMLNLAVVGVAIGGRRMARHDMVVGREWDERLGAFIAMSSGVTPDATDFASMFSARADEVQAQADRLNGSD